MAIAGREWLEKKFLPWFGPVALLALIYTVLVLFGLQVWLWLRVPCIKAHSVRAILGPGTFACCDHICASFTLRTSSILCSKLAAGSYLRCVCCRQRMSWTTLATCAVWRCPCSCTSWYVSIYTTLLATIFTSSGLNLSYFTIETESFPSHLAASLLPDHVDRHALRHPQVPQHLRAVRHAGGNCNKD